MTKDEFINELESIFDVHSKEKLTEETSLKSIAGFDSAGMLSLLAFFSEELEIELSVDRIRKAQTVHDLMELTQNKVQ